MDKKTAKTIVKLGEDVYIDEAYRLCTASTSGLAAALAKAEQSFLLQALPAIQQVLQKYARGDEKEQEDSYLDVKNQVIECGAYGASEFWQLGIFFYEITYGTVPRNEKVVIRIEGTSYEAPSFYKDLVFKGSPGAFSARRLATMLDRVLSTH